MPPKRKTPKKQSEPKIKGVIDGAGLIVEQKIASTIEKNYMPYAMSVILSRAIPEIDGFKPSHRKLLYTMYKMGLLSSGRTKSANIVGQTMKLNPHGDSAIYETMVRMTRGNEALLHPYIDSKGNFGKAYSRDMAYAASRYTEAKLEEISKELFKDIEKDTVDFVDNYDNTMKEPSLLPAAFPSVLVNSNSGIAVGMASQICSFNLKEICDTTISLIKDKNHNIMTTLPAPDFSGGGKIIYDEEVFDGIYKTGRGSFKVRSVYSYDKQSNCIDITEIPPTTTIEAIVEKIVDLVKQGKLREISDVRDETGIDGLKITIDLKRGIDPDKLMVKLFKATPLEDTFPCNFNILIGGVPRVLGIYEILEEWTAFRVECVSRRTGFELRKKRDKLHLLQGLEKILLDIDKAIKIVRETAEEALVVPNLMAGFSIDEIQAEYVAEIKLRHLNREYILDRTKEIEGLEKEIKELEDIISSKAKIKNIIVAELKEIGEKYGKPRKSQIIYKDEIEEEAVTEEVPDYPVNVFYSKEGYFKKITPQSLRMSGEQKLKDGDEIISVFEASNACDLLFFSDRSQVYKSKCSEFSDTKASALGEFIPARLGFDENENVKSLIVTKDYSGYLLFFFENGKVAKISLSAYETKTNRKKLTGAYSDKSPLVSVAFINEDREFILTSTSGRILLFNSASISEKTTRSTQGVSVMRFKKGHRLLEAKAYNGEFLNPQRYRTKTLPALGAIPKDEDSENIQITLI